MRALPHFAGGCRVILKDALREPSLARNPPAPGELEVDGRDAEEDHARRVEVRAEPSRKP